MFRKDSELDGVAFHKRVLAGFRISMYAQSRRERWSDERIFQTARRIAQGHMQLQVYREWLPTVVGSNIMSYYNLVVSSTQSEYDSSVDPSLWSEFAGGAFRFGHSLIQNVFQNRDYRRDSEQRNLHVATRDAFSTIPNYYDTNSGFIVENIIAGMYRQKGETMHCQLRFPLEYRSNQSSQGSCHFQRSRSRFRSHPAWPMTFIETRRSHLEWILQL